MNEKRLKIIVLAAILGIIIIPILVAVNSSYTAIIQDGESNYYLAKNLIIIGDYGFCMKQDTVSKQRPDPLKQKDDAYSISFVHINTLSKIEIMQSAIPETEVAGNYLGSYRITAGGHKGYLYLREDKGKLYGVIRFPQWGHGANEYLYSIKIINGQIQFIRSATTANEIKRLGAVGPFVQRYFGSYGSYGNTIQGYYYNNKGDKNIWEAKR
jgi:hypothetical protein